MQPKIKDFRTLSLRSPYYTILESISLLMDNNETWNTNSMELANSPFLLIFGSSFSRSDSMLSDSRGKADPEEKMLRIPPGCAVFAVFDGDAHFFELVADLIGAFPLFLFAGFGAFDDQCIDLFILFA